VALPPVVQAVSFTCDEPDNFVHEFKVATKGLSGSVVDTNGVTHCGAV
jgi:hypothetical protein